jgi:WS/DGAT/MGAT family acyltransferase
VAGAALTRPGQTEPFHARLGEQRRLAVARTRLADYRCIRDAFGASVNDVVLAVVAGALRGWLLSRSRPLRPATGVRALVPTSVADVDRVQPVLVDLPVGEPDAVLRLAQVRYATAGHRGSDRAVRADRIAGLGGFAPPTLHALGARAAAGLAGRLFALVVTNVPGPQVPLFAAGARMTEMFPVLPLTPGHAVSIGLTSYDGGVYYGVNADRDAVRDVGLLAELIQESLAELVAATATSAVAVRGRPRDGLGRSGSSDRTDR